jgi:signal transduction histidine kinase
MIGGTFILLLTIGLALLLARKIARPLSQLRLSARSLGQGKEIEDINTTLSEVTEVNDALKSASRERAENEEKIRILYDRAQEAVRIRDTFMSVASHELKTPITTIKLQFQLLNRLLTRAETIRREELERPIERVDKVVNRLTDLIDDLLDVSRISAGRLTYHPEPVSLAPFINNIIQGLEEEAIKNGSIIYFRQEDEIQGEWDKHRLEQITVNLITNAIKYGNSNPIFVTIRKSGEQAMIEVKDHGMGISESNLPKIFDRFERVGNHNGITGLGLGLWIVKKVLEGFNGEISVESKVGEGSTFRVYLPLSMELQELVSYNG